MPKKTKKEKLLAHYHNKVRLLENKQAIVTPVQTKTVIVEPIVQEYNQSNKYFFSDLKKSLLLIIIIIGLEVSLYFVKLIK